MMKEEKVNIHKDHRKRMREKFEKIGFEGWQKHEVLEFMLYYVYPRQDTNPIAHNILNYNMNSLVQMLENSKDMCMAEAVDGVGEKTVQYLKTLKAFIEYYRAMALEERPVQLTQDNFMEVIQAAGASRENEEIIMVCLDKLMYVKNVVKVTGYSDEGYAVATTDKIVRIATGTGAKNVILIHTHPSGNSDVSMEDIHTTVKLNKLFEALQITLIDHFLVSGGEFVSIKVAMDRMKNKGKHLSEGGKRNV